MANLDARPSLLKPSQTDVLFVIESGVAPSLSSVTIPVPLLVNNLGVVPISFPVLHTDTSHIPKSTSLLIDSKDNLPLAAITSIDNLSKRALRDDMPGIIFRGALRAIAKTASQKVVNDQSPIAGLALNIINIATESADERTWRTLPATISVGRMTLPSGKHEMAIGDNKQTIDIQGSHAVVLARLIGNQVFWSQPVYGPQMPVYVAPPPAPVVQEPENTEIKQEKKSSKSKKSRKSTRKAKG